MAELLNNMLCCPKCLQIFVQKIDKNIPIICKQCHQTYSSIDNYYDFYISDELTAQINYPPELKHLYFDLEKLLYLTCPKSNIFFNIFFKRHIFNRKWELK